MWWKKSRGIWGKKEKSTRNKEEKKDVPGCTLKAK
jgi:hypothetical protein